MEAVDLPNSFEKIFYIPHHCVFNPNSSTTKLRVVFDASVKSPAGPSLNDILYIGRKLQKDIMVILLNFRLHPYAFTSDLKQMFRRILVQEDQQDYQRILWRFSPRDQIQDFKLKTVTLGVCSSPFLAIRTLSQLCEDEGKEFPNACAVLMRDMYVDDIITGADSLNNAKSLQAELISLLKKGGFELCKWTSNHPSLLNHLPPKDCQQSTLSFATHDFAVKILGLKWNPTLDVFLYDVISLDRGCSKRIILSEISKIFDPLGFLAPLSFFAKHLIKYLWILGLEWDQLPPPEVVERWSQYKQELSLLSEIKIPRHIPKTFTYCQLHGFSDSSEKGYSGVVYLRLSYSDETHKVFLICAKSEVAPMKFLSIARSELCGAVLLADLIKCVSETYVNNLVIDRVFAWTDSMVALSWIKSSSYRWKTFVCNRVSHIQENVSPKSWYYINTKYNPADCASRGLLPLELLRHPLWFSGPPWLKTSVDEWPVELSLTLPPTDLERKEIVLTTFISLESLDTLLKKYSSLGKIKRIVGYVLRFIYNSKHPHNKLTAPFNQSELHNSLLVMVKRVQHTSFSHEINQLENKLPLPKIFRKLNPFLGTDGLLRVGGRLQHSGLAYEHKYPAILPRSHRLTELIIEDTHREYFHPGLQSLHFLLSQNFWILSPKRAIRHVLSKCLRCFRVNPTPLEPFMGNLPSFRINQLKPFSCVGVDFGGPFFVTPSKGRGIKSQKAYICLFICATTKAIHLELVSDLTTQAFLAALRRFIARRGRCSRILSDHGTNFVGASRILTKLFKEACDIQQITWSFQAPAAPHFNGLSEAGIKSVKSHLIRIIGSQILTFEEFYTLLTQVEAILNSRPLYSMSSDPHDLSVLTPGHFLTQEPLTVLPDPDLSHLRLNQLDRWQLLQKLHQDIWKRWHNEYLHTLQQRQKWLNKTNILSPGDLVIIKNENVPPLNWRMGKVVKIFPGLDGIARVASVRTAQGLLQRPLVKLCLIPSQLPS
ncbi:uncharacterized protein [Leptinotarsa decemlineata]|uniref:uncharacterized protein n=1 Tax=Leptinotarsa decemlineata TaxID=7539 RepID=UPI003D309CCA